MSESYLDKHIQICWEATDFQDTMSYRDDHDDLETSRLVTWIPELSFISHVCSANSHIIFIGNSHEVIKSKLPKTGSIIFAKSFYSFRSTWSQSTRAWTAAIAGGACFPDDPAIGRNVAASQKPKQLSCRRERPCVCKMIYGGTTSHVARHATHRRG